MNAPDHGTDVVPDEGAVRAALAAHPWPRFGEGLQGRLMAIATTPPEASIDAQRDGRRPAADGAGSPAAPREMRRWRREVWATGAVMAVIGGLALSVLSFGGPQNAQPVEEWKVIDPVPAPHNAITEVLTGHLYYLSQTMRVDDPVSLIALDMRSGRSERLWTGPNRTSLGVGPSAISPDHTRVAFIRRRSSAGDPAMIYIRALDRDAPESHVLTTSNDVTNIRWSRDGRSLFYSATFPGTPEWVTGYPPPDRFPDVTRWELHRLGVKDVRRFRFLGFGSADEGLRSHVRYGADSVVVRLDAATIGPADYVSLTSLDEDRRRVVVTTGMLSGPRRTSIIVVDLSSGATINRIHRTPDDASTICRETPDPITLACATSRPRGIELLDLESGRFEGVPNTAMAEDHYPQPVRSNTRWLVSTNLSEFDRHSPLEALDVTARPPRLFRVPGASGDAVLFAPGTSVLLTTDSQLVDLDAAAKGANTAVTSMPWALPDEIVKNVNIHIVGWLADAAPARRP